MKKTLLTNLFASLLASTILTPALSAQLNADSKIDAVTVFPQGAEITRIAQINVKSGEHTLLLNDLPGDVDPLSIRVSTTGNGSLEIRGIDSNSVHVSSRENMEAQRKTIELEIETLNDQLTALEQDLKTLSYQRRLIQESAIRPIPVSRQNEDMQASVPDLGNLFDLVAERLKALDGETLAVKISIRKTREAIDNLHLDLDQLAPKQDTKLNVSVDFASQIDAVTEFQVTYRVQNAGWQPFYDARLTIGEKGNTPNIELIRRAEIIQATTESWNNVALTLSTTRSTGATSVPQLMPTEFHPPRFQPLHKSSRYNSDAVLNELAGTTAKTEDSLQAPAPERDLDAQLATPFTAGFKAAYKIAGRYTVDNKGAAKKVRIADERLPASLSVHAAPTLDLNAYLTASFTPVGANPLLPGRVMLFRDNVYMGQGHLPLIASGEEHALGFGVDDRVKITRSEAKRKTGESGILTTERVEENSWVTRVKNLHDRDMNIRIYDRMPYAVNENIEVTLMKNTTRPNERDVEGKRGIYGWEYDLQPGTEKTIRFGYRITHPQT